MPDIAVGGNAFIWSALKPANAAGAIAPIPFASNAFIVVAAS